MPRGAGHVAFTCPREKPRTKEALQRSLRHVLRSFDIPAPKKQGWLQLIGECAVCSEENDVAHAESDDDRVLWIKESAKKRPLDIVKVN